MNKKISEYPPASTLMPHLTACDSKPALKLTFNSNHSTILSGLLYRFENLKEHIYWIRNFYHKKYVSSDVIMIYMIQNLDLDDILF
jgi:hypothetical protein